MFAGDTLANDAGIFVHEDLGLLSWCVKTSLGEGNEARSLGNLSPNAVESFSKHLSAILYIINICYKLCEVYTGSLLFNHTLS